MAGKKKLEVEKFTGVYCSGLLIPDSRLINALSLIFDQFYILNNIEYIIEFVKHHEVNIVSKGNEIYKLSYGDDLNSELTKVLTDQQRKTFESYLELLARFFWKHRDLIGDVIKTKFCPNDSAVDAELIKEGGNGKPNTYKIIPRLILSGDDLSQLDDLIGKGALPALGQYPIKKDNIAKDMSAGSLAAILATKCVALSFPGIKEVDDGTILEARYKLRDYLPPFWSSMLKLSIELKKRIEADMSLTEIDKEGGELFQTIVRPALIDLNRKMAMERRNWFYRILAPIGNSIKIFVGNSQLTTANLLSVAATLGVSTTSNYIENYQKVDSLSKESGLTFLIKLNEIIDKKTINL